MATVTQTQIPVHDISGTVTHENESFITILLLVPFCLLIGNLTRHICVEFKVLLPYTVILLLLGMFLGFLESYINLGVLGEAIAGVKNMSPHLLLGAFIPPLVFESAFNTEYHVMRHEFASALLLAFPGVILNTLLTAIFCVYAFPYNWSWSQAITFGSIVSATDPVAVVSILNELGASKRLATLIEGESLLNDGAAFVLYTIALQFVKGENPSVGKIIGEFCQLTFGGIFMGILFGIASVIWLRLVFTNEKIEIVITVISCFLVYWVCENSIHASGVLGTVFLGLMLSKYKSAISPQIEESMHAFWEVFSYIMNTLIFIFGGIIVVIGVFEDKINVINGSDFGWNFLLYIILHIARFITISVLWCCLSNMGYGINIKQGIVLGLSGIRGVIALALALMVKLEALAVTDSGIGIVAKLRALKYQDEVLFHVSLIVFWTLILNGTFMKYIVQGLGLTKTSDEAIIILKDTMRHLRKATKIKMLGMKGNPTYSGANWEEVTRSLPSYAHMLGEKDMRPKSKNNICKNLLCCCGNKTTHTYNSKSNVSYQKIDTDKPEFAHQKSNHVALLGKYNESTHHMQRFGIKNKSNKSLSYSFSESKNKEIESHVVIEMTDINDEENKENNIEEIKEMTPHNNKPLSDADFTSKYMSPTTKKDTHYFDTAHIHNTIKLMVERSKHIKLEDIITETEMLTPETTITETEGCKQQIKHRVLLVLKRAYHSTFEEGIISVDSYMILEDGISSALDCNNINELNKRILKTFHINKCIQWLYSHCKTSISQYLIMKELTIAIEVGMVFITTFDILIDKLNIAP
eukprot:547153_1